MVFAAIGTETKLPAFFDGPMIEKINQSAFIAKSPVALPLVGFGAGFPDRPFGAFEIDIFDAGPVPLSKTRPEPPAFEACLPLLAQVFRQIFRSLSVNSHDMDASPSGFLGELAGQLDANVAIRHEVDMQTMGFVEFKNPQSAQIGPFSFEEGQEMVPELPSLLDLQNVRKGERPHIQPMLGKSLGRELEGGLALSHGRLWSCLIFNKVKAGRTPRRGVHPGPHPFVTAAKALLLRPYVL